MSKDRILFTILCMERILKAMQKILGDEVPFEKILTMKPDFEDPRVKKYTYEMLCDAYENTMPFNKVLGVKVLKMSPELVETRIDMKDELVGNFHQHILHGGVISSVLDLSGGIVIQAAVLAKINGCTIQHMFERFSVMGTIDMRVDFLRPGRGAHFITRSETVRAGNKVGVARMEMHNDQGVLIAHGTGAYKVG